MKKNVWLLIELMIGPFLLFGQSTSIYRTDIRQNNLSLSTNDQMTSNNADTIIQYDVEPKLVKRVEPKYPPKMLKDLWEADVFLKAFIDINGNVTDVQSMKVQVSPHKSVKLQKKESGSIEGKEFQDSAIAAARKWAFTPAQKQGKSVTTWVTIPFRFRISTGEEDDLKDTTLRGKYTRILRSTRIIVDDVLQGINMSEVIQRHLDPDAYIIFGNKYTGLYSVLKNGNKDIALIEGEKSKSRLLHFILSDDKTTLLLTRMSKIEKDGPERYHTILFVKSKQDDWQIKHWHVSW